MIYSITRTVYGCLPWLWHKLMNTNTTRPEWFLVCGCCNIVIFIERFLWLWFVFSILVDCPVACNAIVKLRNHRSLDLQHYYYNQLWWSCSLEPNHQTSCDNSPIQLLKLLHHFKFRINRFRPNQSPPQSSGASYPRSTYPIILNVKYNWKIILRGSLRWFVQLGFDSKSAYRAIFLINQLFLKHRLTSEKKIYKDKSSINLVRHHLISPE